MHHILIILAFSLLCAGWIGIQFLAKKMGTKNHFDDLNNGCGNCTCGGVGDSCHIPEIES